MNFVCFSAVAFAECQSRLARNEITENVKNMQIAADCPPNMILHMVFNDNTNTYEKLRQEAPIAVREDTSGGRRRKACRETQEQVEQLW